MSKLSRHLCYKMITILFNFKIKNLLLDKNNNKIKIIDKGE